MKLAEIVPVLQVAVGAVILVSGVGLLLLTKTNRLGRIIDRTRLLVRELRTCPAEDRPLIEGQLEILGRRGRLLRTAIALTTCSMLFAATLVIVLFLATLLRVEAAVVLVALFVACMASLIAGLLWFLRDVDLSLRALQLEVEGYRAALGASRA